MPIDSPDKLYKAKRALQAMTENPVAFEGDEAYEQNVALLQGAIAEYEGDDLGMSAEAQDLQARGVDVAPPAAPPPPELSPAARALSNMPRVDGGRRMGDVVAEKARSLGIDTLDPTLQSMMGGYSFPQAEGEGPQLASMDSASQRPELYQPAKNDVEGFDPILWEEPPLERAREALRPYLGEAADTLAETDKEYQAYSDWEYKRAYEKATSAGQPIVRVDYVGKRPGPGASALGVLGGGLNDVRAIAGSAQDMASYGLASIAREKYKDAVKGNGAWRALPVAGGPFGALVPWALPGQTEVGGGGTESEASPYASAIGALGGIVGPGASNAVARGLTGLAKKGAGPGAGALKRAAAGGLGGAAAGLVDAAGWQAGDLAQGKPASMEDLAMNATLGVLLGGPLGGLTEGLSAAAARGANKLRGGTAMGELLDAVEPRGQELGMLGGTRVSPRVQKLAADGEGHGAMHGAIKPALERLEDPDVLVERVMSSPGAQQSVENIVGEGWKPLSAAAGLRQELDENAFREAYEGALRTGGGQRRPLQNAYQVVMGAWKRRRPPGGGRLPAVKDPPPIEQYAQADLATPEQVRERSRYAQVDAFALEKAIAKFGEDRVRSMLRGSKAYTAEAADQLIKEAAEGKQRTGVFVVLKPREFTLRDLMEMEPHVDALAKASSKDPNLADPLYGEIRRALYEDRSAFAVPELSSDVEAALDRYALPPGDTRFVATPSGSSLATGYGNLKAAHAGVIEKRTAQHQLAGLPADVPGTEQALGRLPKEIEDARRRYGPRRLDAAQQQAARARLARFRGELDPDGLFDLDPGVGGSPEDEAVARIMGDRLYGGDPAAGFSKRAPDGMREEDLYRIIAKVGGQNLVDDFDRSDPASIRRARKAAIKKWNQLENMLRRAEDDQQEPLRQRIVADFGQDFYARLAEASEWNRFQSSAESLASSLERVGSRNRLGNLRDAVSKYGEPALEARELDVLRSVLPRGSTGPGSSEEVLDALDKLSRFNALGAKKKDQLANILRDIPGNDLMSRRDEIERLVGKGAYKDVEQAWAATMLKRATTEPAWRVALSKVPLLSALVGGVKLPNVQMGHFGTADVSTLGRMAYPTLRALGSSAADFPKPGPNQARRFGRSLALKGEPTSLPAWLNAITQRERVYKSPEEYGRKGGKAGGKRPARGVAK